MKDKLLVVQNLSKHYLIKKGFLAKKSIIIKAINDVSFDIGYGEILGLVGESGSGKSTIGRSIIKLEQPNKGKILLEGVDITNCSKDDLKKVRQIMSLVFQDPYASLNPRKTIEKTIETPLLFDKENNTPQERIDMIKNALEIVGLPYSYAKRFPHEFSGGQRQRIGIARSLVTKPKLIIADEPVSALDVSVQAQIINLLKDIREKHNTSILFIAHDLSVVGHICDRVAVVYLGKIMEIATKKTLYMNPKHPYTEALFSASPVAIPNHKKQRVILKGDIPSPINLPQGCVFNTRCPYAIDDCFKTIPSLKPQSDVGHLVACIRDDLKLKPWQTE